jgi:hypothetical protein
VIAGLLIDPHADVAMAASPSSAAERIDRAFVFMELVPPSSTSFDDGGMLAGCAQRSSRAP